MKSGVPLSLSGRALLPLASLPLLGLLAALLYVPFLGNAVVFDDHWLFTDLVVFDYAQIPFDSRPRTFAYFTLGLIHVLTHSIAANRIANLVLHILCAWMLYRLAAAFMCQAFASAVGDDAQCNKDIERRSRTLGLIIASWFAVHPMMVYGTGYLVQRTILLATLFSLLSLWFYCRSFSRNRIADLFTAALFYWAAVMAKEHAVMLPFVALAITPLYGSKSRKDWKRAALYFLLCVPAAVLVVVNAKYAIATAYEPDAKALMRMLGEMNLDGSRRGQWIASILTQSNLFFDYLYFWVIPDVRQMSIDMRLDFLQLWNSWWLLPKALLFFACPLIGLALVRRGKAFAVFGSGLLYCWLLYLTELASVRIQEPFVLYRAYIWAPGFALMAMALLWNVRTKWLVWAFLPVLLTGILLARERLASFADDGALWQDAAAKLKSASLPGSDRIFYNRALSYIKDKNYTAAIADLSAVIANRPDLFYAVYYRGVAYYYAEDLARAEQDFKRAERLDDKNAPLYFAIGMLREKQGCMEGAIRAFSKSGDLGFIPSKQKLKMMEQKKHAAKGTQVTALTGCMS